jgi:choline dehydrogenase-like flavoprotein
MTNELPVIRCAHQAGACQFGTDPITSALNTDCRAHKFDNLYVVDTNVPNAAHTAMADTPRVDDHLLTRLA